MNSRVILTIAMVSLGLIIAAVPQNTTRPNKISADQLLVEIKNGQQYINPEEVADMLIQADPSIQLIDVRNSDEFNVFSLPGAINIPLESVLLIENEDYLNQDIKTNVFYSNGTLQANEAWMITRQLGYKNNYVLMGGLNYWVESIANPSKPNASSPNEELARYNFRLAAGKALGGNQTEGISAEISTETKALTPSIPKIEKKKKKPVAGGCS
jgi:sulfur-carrier protein adenylyltransferase/sulfurtransferase